MHRDRMGSRTRRALSLSQRIRFYRFWRPDNESGRWAFTFLEPNLSVCVIYDLISSFSFVP